ncbi:FAD-dependent oxidoreductase [Streptomyces sp. AV19]|uniref:NAD(P)/FAD-dependent oxidoreductase n=1 Tax=Streptomyces sp. AV19 TaxID=2793068 RepID=UPI0018FE9426|nr:FAD-dependent oxidoreductase [Streptomyces sp. AV19]MBH1937255.1 FAD-dependent oxidoreductase [Streptomyces sp. AV19]MDG4536733.1 FAD-binding oxidoreductase [Streptomyces sp. AV19]
MSAETADAVVVGNGVLGLSIAYEVAVRAPGARTVVVGRAARPGAATVAAGAMLNCFGDVTALTGAHPASETRFALARAALDAWPRWLDRLEAEADGTPVPRVKGTFVVLGAQATSCVTENYEAVLAAAAKYGERHREIDPQEIDGLAPLPQERPLRALHLEREGAVDARAVLALLETATARRGVEPVDDEVTGLVVSGGRAVGVRLASGGTVAAGSVVLAAGAATQRLVDQLPPGMVQPVLYGSGSAVETLRTDGPGFREVVRTPVQSEACGLHIVPLGGSREYIGATNSVRFDEPRGPFVGQVEFLLRRAREQFDERVSYSAAQRWHYGFRPITLDTFPLLGQSPLPGLLFATGTYRDGFHGSPVIAEHLARLLTEPASYGPGPYSVFEPGRAPIETMTVPEAVELYAAEMVATSVEFGLRLPYSFIDMSVISDMYRQRARRSFDRLGRGVALEPEILRAVSEADEGRVERVAAYLRLAMSRS